MFTPVKRTELYPLPDLTVERSFAASLVASMKLAQLKFGERRCSDEREDETDSVGASACDSKIAKPNGIKMRQSTLCTSKSAVTDDMALLAKAGERIKGSCNGSLTPPCYTSDYRHISSEDRPTEASCHAIDAKLTTGSELRMKSGTDSDPSASMANKISCHSSHAPPPANPHETIHSVTAAASLGLHHMSPNTDYLVNLWRMDLWLIAGEAPVFVGLACHHSRLVLTNYRLFHGAGSPLYSSLCDIKYVHPSRGRIRFATSTADATDEVYFSIAICMIDRVRHRDLLILQLDCKDGRIYRIQFESGDVLEEWRSRIELAVQPPARNDTLFAFTHFAWHSDLHDAETSEPDLSSDLSGASLSEAGEVPSLLEDRDSASWFDAEVRRLHFDLQTTWRISQANREFKLCPTYPELILVPHSISDADLERVATFRSARRIPSVVFRYAPTGAILARSSQPEVGLLGWRSSEDERLIQAMADACAFDASRAVFRHHSSSSVVSNAVSCNGHVSSSAAHLPVRTRWQSDGHSISMQNSGSNMGQRQGSSECLDSSGASDANVDVKVHMRPARRLLIVDARSYAAAVTNRARGGGVECEEYYPNAEILFMYLANIHAIRKSFHSLRDLLNGSVGAGSSAAPRHHLSDRASLSEERVEDCPTRTRSSMSFSDAAHVSEDDSSLQAPSIVNGPIASSVAPAPSESAFYQSLDATRWLANISALLVSAVRVVNALTVEARPVLVHCSDGWDRTPQIVALAQLLIDPYYRTLDGFQVLIKKEWLDHGHKMQDRCGLAADENERSPIFLQWLDCCYQLTNQFQTAFEFNSTYLALLARHAYSNLFGDFIGNSLRERIDLSVDRRTKSVFDYLNDTDQRPYVINYLYDDTSTHLAAKSAILWPKTEARELTVWRDVYISSAIESRRVTPRPHHPARLDATDLGRRVDLVDEVNITNLLRWSRRQNGLPSTIFAQDGLLHIDSPEQSKFNAILYTSLAYINRLKCRLAEQNQIIADAKADNVKLAALVTASTPCTSPTGNGQLVSAVPNLPSHDDLVRHNIVNDKDDGDGPRPNMSGSESVTLKELADALTELGSATNNGSMPTNDSYSSLSSSVSSYTLSSGGSSMVVSTSGQTAASKTPFQNGTIVGRRPGQSQRRWTAAADRLSAMFGLSPGVANVSNHNSQPQTTSASVGGRRRYSSTVSSSQRRGPSTSSWESVGLSADSLVALDQTEETPNSVRVSLSRWLAENAVSSCSSCDRQLWFGRHRHHCRLCGKRICSSCSIYVNPDHVPCSKTYRRRTLTASSPDRDAPNAAAMPLRVCSHCSEGHATVGEAKKPSQVSRVTAEVGTQTGDAELSICDVDDGGDDDDVVERVVEATESGDT